MNLPILIDVPSFATQSGVKPTSQTWSPTSVFDPTETLELPKAIEHRLLTGLQDMLIKNGAQVISYGRNIAFRMVEAVVGRKPFGVSPRLIVELWPDGFCSAYFPAPERTSGVFVRSDDGCVISTPCRSACLFLL